MDSIIEKFYNGGNNINSNNFTNLRFQTTNPINTIGLSHTSKSPLPVRPMISTVNSASINIPHKPILTINTNFNNNLSPVKPHNLAFNSSSDLLYNNKTLTHRRYNSDYNMNNIRNNTYADIKRNDTKMQMMEEKMKNLELKSQRLEVINDFFFDMFENNLVKEEINKQRENAAKIQKQKNKEEGYEVSSSSSESDSNTDSVSNSTKKKKKNKKKMKKKNLNLNNYDFNNILKKKEEFDPIKYQKQKLEHNQEVLDNIKKNVSNYLFEEELKKNEQLQILGETINELKSKLINKLDKMQMVQNHQIEKVMFCLLNSDFAEDLPTHLFNSGKDTRRSTRLNSFNKASNKNVPNRNVILNHVGQGSIPEEND